MGYSKPWLGYEEQLSRLKDRGLKVTDDTKALEYLKRIGYYRISGYWFPFRERSEVCCPMPSEVMGKYKKGQTDRIVLDQFKAGSSFELAVELYVFDKKLRLLVMDALERIEIALRVDISHRLGKYDPFSYLKSGYFHESFSDELDIRSGLTKHHEWLDKHAKLINRSKEGFIKHNKVKYGLPIPTWVACEVWDFGCLSTLYAGLKVEDQDCISGKYGISNGRVFASWLRSLNYLRNVCAHHSRLWNRNIVDQPKKPATGEVPIFESAWNAPHIQARPFLLLCIAQHLLKTINPSSSWWTRLKQLLLSFPSLDHLDLSLEGMGVIEGWKDWS